MDLNGVNMLATEFRSRSPFVLKRLPLLGRFYLRAYHSQAGQMRSWLTRGLRLLFPLYYHLTRFSVGEFTYLRLNRQSTVRFNARNLQFQALYGPVFQNGYEPEVAALLDILLNEGAIFFDIGSNWGYFSLYAASNYERLTVHAFEPTAGTFFDLASCVKEARLASMITCHHIALSSRDGETSIHIPDGLHSGQATVSSTGGKARVMMRRLDAMTLPAPDVIKMDVEGHETEVLRGSIQILRSTRPFIVFENKPDQTMPQRALEPLFFLKELGYNLYIPTVQRTQSEMRYSILAEAYSPKPRDMLALVELEPEKRLLLLPDLNVLACHQSRLSQLADLLKS